MYHRTRQARTPARAQSHTGGSSRVAVQDLPNLLGMTATRNKRVLIICIVLAAIVGWIGSIEFVPIAVGLLLYLSLLMRLRNRTDSYFNEHILMGFAASPSEGDLKELSSPALERFSGQLKSGISGIRAAAAVAVLVVGFAVDTPRHIPDYVFGSIIVATAWLAYHLFPVDQVRPQKLGVVFRRFSKSPDTDLFCLSVAVATRGVSNFLTLQDQSFSGDGMLRRYAFAYLLAILPIPIVMIAVRLQSPLAILIISVVFICSWLLTWQLNRDSAIIDV